MPIGSSRSVRKVAGQYPPLAVRAQLVQHRALHFVQFNRDDEAGAVKSHRCQLVICRSRFQDKVARLLNGNWASPIDELDDALDIVYKGACTFYMLTLRVDHCAGSATCLTASSLNSGVNLCVLMTTS